MVAALVALAMPATATAADTTTTTRNLGANLTVIPYEDCITAHGNGSTLVWYGYYSFARGNTTINLGPQNVVTPHQRDGVQPTTFQAGNVARAFSVITPKGTTASWTLNGFPATAPKAGAINCDSGDLTIVAFVACFTANKDGTTTAIYGDYSSADGTTTINKGPQNNITPASLEGPEPVRFASGLNTDAFPLTIPKGVTGTWTVNGFSAAAPNGGSPACQQVSAPEEGNGLGLVLALIVAGGAGALMIRRVVARGAAR